MAGRELARTPMRKIESLVLSVGVHRTGEASGGLSNRQVIVYGGERSHIKAYVEGRGGEKVLLLKWSASMSNYS